MKKLLLIFLCLVSFSAKAFETQDDMNEFGAKLAGYYLANHLTKGQEDKMEKAVWFLFEDYMRDETQALKTSCSSCYDTHISNYQAKPSLSLKTNRIMLRVRIKF